MPSPLTLPVRYTRHKPPLGAPLRHRVRGLQNYWPFLERAGGRVRDAATGITTALATNTTWVPSPAGATIKTGGAGTPTSVTQTTEAQPVAPFSIFTRLMLDALPAGNGQAVYGGSIHSAGIVIDIFPTGTVYLIKDQVAGILQTAATLTPHVWYDIVVTYDGGTANIYLNGGLSISGSSAQTFAAMDTWLFGSNNSGEGYDANAAMTVDHVGVCGVVLSPAEVRSLYVAPYQCF
jgi:hypothetical protein